MFILPAQSFTVFDIMRKIFSYFVQRRKIRNGVPSTREYEKIFADALKFHSFSIDGPLSKL